MPRFKVQHSYAAERGGSNTVQFGPWAEGDEVEVDAPDAEWVNRDSPRTLVEVDAKPKTAKKAAAKKAASAPAQQTAPPKPADDGGSDGGDPA